MGKAVEEWLAKELGDTLGEEVTLPVATLLPDGFTGLREGVELGESREVKDGVAVVDCDWEALLVEVEVLTGDLERLGDLEEVPLARADLDARGETETTVEPVGH